MPAITDRAISTEFSAGSLVIFFSPTVVYWQLPQLKPQGHKRRLSTNPHLYCGCCMLQYWEQLLGVQAKITSKQLMWNRDFLLTVIPLKNKYSLGMLECWFSGCVRTATTDACHLSLAQLVHLMMRTNLDLPSSWGKSTLPNTDRKRSFIPSS